MLTSMILREAVAAVKYGDFNAHDEPDPLEEIVDFNKRFAFPQESGRLHHGGHKFKQLSRCQQCGEDY